MITRRRFASLLALFGAVGGVRVQSATPNRYGRVDLERWNREGFRQDGARVLVDGLDITNDCFRFDDIEGWADVYLKNADGKRFMDPIRFRAAQRRVHGTIMVDYKSARA